MAYNFLEVEKKWQDYWDRNESFKAVKGDKKDPYYILVEPGGTYLRTGLL